MECDVFNQVEFIELINLYLGPTAASVADFVYRELGIEDNVLLILSSLAVDGNLRGNTCLDLSILGSSIHAKKKSAALNEPIILPPLDQLLERLHQTPVLVECVSVEDLVLSSASSAARSFVLLGNNLFTRRQFVDELSVATNLTNRHRLFSETIAVDKYSLVDAVLPHNESEVVIDGVTKTVLDSIQNDAGRAVLDRKLVVLTGGPGTGKTYTMIRLLALAIASHQGSLEHFSVAVCAPTGKAAARAGEELSKFVEQEKLTIDSEKQFSDDVLD